MLVASSRNRLTYSGSSSFWDRPWILSAMAEAPHERARNVGEGAVVAVHVPLLADELGRRQGTGRHPQEGFDPGPGLQEVLDVGRLCGRQVDPTEAVGRRDRVDAVADALVVVVAERGGQHLRLDLLRCCRRILGRGKQ